MSRFFASASASESEEEFRSTDEEVEEVLGGEKKRAGLFEALSASEDEFSEGFTEEEGEEEEESTHEGRPAAPVRKSRFLFDTESESSEEESTQRQIKSQKEKIQEEMTNLSEALEAGIESPDWIAMQEDFDRLLKLITKHQSNRLVPFSVYCILHSLDAALAKYAGDAEFKLLNAGSARAFNILRQRARKATQKYSVEIEHAQRIRDGKEAEDSIATELVDPVTRTAMKAITEEVTSKASELTPETLLKRLQEILGTRGRKHVDKTENVAILRKMITMATNRRHIVHVLVALVATQFEIASIGHLGYFALDTWNTILGDLLSLIEQLEGLGEALMVIPKDEEDLGLPSAAGLRGSLISYSQRLDDEFIRALQNIDPHSSEYPDFLRQEPRLYLLLDRCRQLVVAQMCNSPTTVVAGNELACQLATRQLEHIYYKPRELVRIAFKSSQTSALALCGFIYQHGVDRQRVRALLCHVYWLALHNEYTKAHDLMMQSHVQDALPLLDISTQILYNRALVQVGIAAFRAGFLKEAYFSLQELCSTGRPKELLAQGLVGQKYTEKGDMDRAERQRLVPFHMQINVEMIDCIFLVVAMLLELPQNAAATRRFFSGERRLFLSRHLRRIVDSHDRSLFNGPPENTREYVVAATKALANGQWRITEENIMKIKIWDQLPQPEEIRTTLRAKIRESALLCFLYQTGPTYASLSLEKLTRIFDLPANTILVLIKSLISEYGMQASISEDEKYICFDEDLESVRQKDLITLLMSKLKCWEGRNLEGSDLMNTFHQLRIKMQKLQETAPSTATTTISTTGANNNNSSIPTLPAAEASVL